MGDLKIHPLFSKSLEARYKYHCLMLSAMSSESDGNFSRASPSRGSLRKILPSLPDLDSQLTMSSKLLESRSNSSRGTHCYNPFYQEYLLLAEYNLLHKQRLSGVYVIPSSKTQLCWYGVIFVHQGLYQGGIFRFKLVIPDNYPHGDCPKILFTPPIFHPMIDFKTGEVDLCRGFPQWKKNVNHVWQVLGYVRKMFYKIEWENPFNSDAAHLLRNDFAGLKCKVDECIANSKKSIYDPPPDDDPHAIRFFPFDPDVHNPVLQFLKTPRDQDHCDCSDNSNATGYSWIKQGSLQPFSKPDS